MNTISKIAGVAVALLAALIPVAAAAGSGPGRYEVVDEEITRYIWAVGSWNYESCRIVTDEIETVPQYQDIAALCGAETTALLNDNVIWLYYIGSFTETRQVKRLLPEIEIRTSYGAADGVTVWAADPLGVILRIEANIDGFPAVCDQTNGQVLQAGGLACSFPIYSPPAEFSAYAVSDYGDTSRSARLRIGNSTAAAGIFTDPKGNRLILGDNAYAKYNVYHDVPMRWGALPDQPRPDWIRNVSNDDLRSDNKYYYLAGQLILEGLVAPAGCDNYGLDGQYATECGALAAFSQVYDYQNAYNVAISAAGARYGVPNRLIKAIVAVESQFYPDALGVSGERGLYQITRDGADTLLRWNGSAFLEICGYYFDNCDLIPYDNLESWQRDLLANYVLNHRNDLTLLAAALKANAYQIDRLLENIAGLETPGAAFTFSQLWAMTVMNYHTGATVTAAVLQQLQQRGDPIDWDHYAAAMERVRPSALEYLARVKSN